MTKSLIRNIESYYTDMGSGQAVVCLHVIENYEGLFGGISM